MPFKSEKQRRYMHANHPEIAKRWEKEYKTGGHVSPSIKAKGGPVKLSNPGNKRFI
jgi:hypothetical protein|tara:strand:+ start:588 stop:755 length:168 start_codon:yes stop_codon:yes gene_type:complete